MRQQPVSRPNDATIVVGLIPRFFLGAVFAVGALQLMTAPHGFTTAVRSYLEDPATAKAPAFFGAFVQQSVLPNVETYAIAIVGAEIFVAFSLLCGLLTRVGAVVAIYLLANFMFARGEMLWSPASGNASDIVLAIVVAMTGPGRILGLDAVLKR